MRPAMQKATARYRGSHGGPLPSKKRRLELYRMDGRKMDRLAIDLVGQVGFYERNIQDSSLGEAEAVRFLHIENLAVQLLKVARRAANRYSRARP